MKLRSAKGPEGSYLPFLYLNSPLLTSPLDPTDITRTKFCPQPFFVVIYRERRMKSQYFPRFPLPRRRSNATRGAKVYGNPGP